MLRTGAAENLHIASVTGVDLKLRIVGLGGRSYAFILDWHFRIAGAIAWYGLSSLVCTATWCRVRSTWAGHSF